MAESQYFQVPGPLGEYYQKTGFSHSVVLPPNAQLVITAGQPGLSTKTGRYSSDPGEQIADAFDNCHAALLAAGVPDGLGAVHKVICFLIDTKHEPLVMQIWRRRYPDHRPTWMTLGTNALCGNGIMVEMQVEAHIVPRPRKI